MEREKQEKGRNDRSEEPERMCKRVLRGGGGRRGESRARNGRGKKYLYRENRTREQKERGKKTENRNEGRESMRKGGKQGTEANE